MTFITQWICFTQKSFLLNTLMAAETGKIIQINITEEERRIPFAEPKKS